MKTIEELRDLPLTYPVQEWAKVEVKKWVQIHTAPSSGDYSDEYLDLVDFTLALTNNGASKYGDLEPEWESLWLASKNLRREYRASGKKDVALCYVILDQVLQLNAPDCDLLEMGFFDRYL